MHLIRSRHVWNDAELEEQQCKGHAVACHRIKVVAGATVLSRQSKAGWWCTIVQSSWSAMLATQKATQ